MPVDLNNLASKLKQQQPVGVDKEGKLTTTNPKNDGSKDGSKGRTTLEPKRFFI